MDGGKNPNTLSYYGMISACGGHLSSIFDIISFSTAI